MKQYDSKDDSTEKEINEEYATDITPDQFHINRSENEDLLSSGINWGVITGYLALFIALFSIAIYPILFGILAILIGLLAIRFGARTLAFTAIGFAAFSVLFSLLYPVFVR